MTLAAMRCSWTARSTASASNWQDDQGVPASRSRTAVRGPVWCSGPTTRWGRRRSAGAAAAAAAAPGRWRRRGTWSGGCSTAFGRPVVPDVNISGGRGTKSAGVLVGPGAREELSHATAPSGLPPREDLLDASGRCRSACHVDGLRAGQDDPGLRDAEHVLDLAGGQVHADGDRRQAGEDQRRVRDHGLDAVVGEHRHPAGGAGVEARRAPTARSSSASSAGQSSDVLPSVRAIWPEAPARAQRRPSAGRSPQLLLQDLPRRALGQLLRTRTSRGYLYAASRHGRRRSRPRGHLRTWAEGHDGDDLLSQSLVRTTDDRCLADRGVAVEHLLDLARVDVVAAADDEVLLAVDEEQEPVLVLVARSPVCSQPPRRASAVASGFL